MLVSLHQPDIQLRESKSLETLTPLRQTPEVSAELDSLLERFSSHTHSASSFDDMLPTALSARRRIANGVTYTGNGFATPLATPRGPVSMMMGFGHAPSKVQYDQYCSIQLVLCHTNCESRTNRNTLYSTDVYNRHAMVDSQLYNLYSPQFSPLTSRVLPSPMSTSRRGFTYPDPAVSPRRGHWRDSAFGHNNSVDVVRIREGSDVRTTVRM